LALLERAKVGFERLDCLFELDMSYVGQTHTVAVPLPLRFDGQRTDASLAGIRAAFERRYRETYGRLLDGIEIRLLNLRVSVVGQRPKFDLALLAPALNTSLSAARRGSRKTYVEGSWHETAVYERLELPAGTKLPGPAILEQDDATIFVEPDLEAEVDRFGNLVLSRKES